MSAVSAIYKAPVVGKGIMPDAGQVSVVIQYNGRAYEGIALLHPEDKDFFSEKVGYNIALSRARIEALKDILTKTRLEAQIKAQIVDEVTRFGEYRAQEDMYDPTHMFRQNVIRALSRVEALEKALTREQAILKNYLKGQAKAIASIKRYRRAQAEAQ